MHRTHFPILLTAALLLLLAAASPAASINDEAPAAKSTTRADEACRAESPAKSVPALRFLTEPSAMQILPAGSVTPNCGDCPPCWVDLVYCRIDCRETYLPDEAATAACIQQCVNDYCGCTAYTCPGLPDV